MKKGVLFFVIFVCSNSISGQDFMSFNDCLDLTIKNNLYLKGALNDEAIASYQYKASYGNLLPTILGTVDNKNTWGREIDPKTNLYVDKNIKNYVGNVGANFNLFSGFSVINYIKLAHEELKINKVNIQKVKNEITKDLAQKFITILYLQEIISANQEQIKSSEKELELAILKFSSGTIAESEVFKIKSQKASEEMNLLTNQNHLEDNLICLKQLMNIALEKEINLIKPILNLNENLELNENQYQLTNKAVGINPSYVMSVLKEKKARTDLALQRSSYYPTLTMRLLYGSNYSITDPIVPFKEEFNTNLSKGLRFTLLIPIFSQFDIYSKVKTSKMNYKQSKLNTQIVQNNLSKEVLKAITDTKTAIKKNESSAIAFEFSRKSYEADALKFELGKININELNISKMIFNNSQAELIQSKYELLYNNALIKFYLGDNFSL